MKDYQSFVEPLRLPINGKVYEVPPAGIHDALIVQGVMDGTDESGLAAKPATELWKLALGSAWDEMVADNVPFDAVTRAGYTALAEISGGREAAEAVWDRDNLPEALAASTPKASNGQAATRRTTRTAAASTTRSRASGTGTRKKKPPAS